MPERGVALEKLGFLTIGLFDGQDPGPGHQYTLEMIELGTAVIPLGWENPLRLAEDLATVDVLSGGRINPGFSVGPPMHWMFARDIIGPSDQIAETLHADPGFREVTEVASALPFTIAPEDYVQILTDMATKLGPALGWQPGR